MQSKHPASSEPPRSAGDLRAWLDDLGLGQYAGLLAANDITAKELALLSDQDLKELGLSLGHRRKLMDAIERNAGPARPAAVEAREPERRQLTIMFCDLVESTALSERLDPEDLSELISAYQNTCAGAIARFEGVVAKLLGDGLLAYFGFPRAHEDAAERAVRAGLQIVAALARHAGDGGPPLKVRIGITTGPVVVGDMIGEATSEQQAVFGETPNVAARLQALARPNTIVISEATRRLVEGLFELDDLGLQSVKGFTRALRAWTVVSERTPESRFEASRSANLTRFVGREREMSVLLDRWSAAARGAGQVVLLSGEAGIGKSRAVQKLLECLAEDDYLRLRYQCSPLHVNSPLHPVIRQVEAACGFSPADAADAKLDKLTAWLGQSATAVDEVLPHYAALLALPGGGRFSELGGAAQNMRVLTALVDHVATQSRKSPILLVFEDAHWIDPSSLLCIRMLAERISAIPVLMIVSFRPPGDRLVIDGPPVTTIDLERLNRSETTALIADVAGPQVLPAFMVERIVEKTDGVPLFAEELTKMMLDANARAYQSGGDRTAAGPSAAELPATLHDLLMARLDQLAPARRVAQIAAVIGREFPFDILAGVASLQAADLRGCLNQLIAAGLISVSRSAPDARFVFKHALVRDAAYSSLLRRDRRRLHAAVAAVIEQHPTRFQLEPELLAHHCTEGGLTDAALRQWAVAGRRALQRAANSEAVAITARALDLLSGLPDTPERRRQELELRLVAGGAYWVVKGFASPDVEQTFTRARDLAESLDDSARLTLALRGLIVCHYVRGDQIRARPLAERLVALSQQIASAADLMWARMMLGAVLFQQGEFARARAELEISLAMHDPIEQSAKTVSSQIDPGILARATLAWTLWVLGLPDQALAASAQAVANARAIGQPSSIAMAVARDATVKLWRGEIDAARQAVAELRLITTEHRIVFYAAFATLLEAAILIESGDCAAGRDRVRQALGEFRAQQAGMSVSWVLSWAVVGCLRDGMHEEALRHVSEGLAATLATGERQWEAELRRLEGDALASSSPVANADAALSSVRAAMRLAGEQGARSLELRAALTLAGILRARGEAETARHELAAVYARFTEGFATADLRAAKAVLDELATDEQVATGTRSSPAPRSRG